METNQLDSINEMEDKTISDIIVLIPHFNNPTGLLRSIDSIVPEEKVDILIVDDGSVKKPDEDKIRGVYRASGKIFFIYNKTNQGIEQALNAGLKFVVDKRNYNFVARLDCGDICMPNRFRIQKQFLMLNRNVYLLGSSVEFVDMKGNLIYSLILPTEHEEIKKKMYFNCVFIHPSVMFRTKAIREKVGYYPLKYEAAEDYAYFFRFLKHYKTAIIKQVLVKCELNPNGLSAQKRKRQVINRIKIIFENFKFGYYPLAGIIRNIVLLILPQNIIAFLKKFILNGR